MNERQRVLLLILSMALMSLLAVGATLTLLYRVPFFRAAMTAGMIIFPLAFLAIWMSLRFLRPVLDEIKRQAAGLEQGNLALKREVDTREHVEEALRECQAQYRRLVEGLPYVVYAFSDKRGAIFYSRGLEPTLGYSPEQMLEKPLAWHDAVHPEDSHKFKSVLDESQRGDALEVEYRIKDAGGRWRWLSDRFMGRRIQEGETITEGIVRDITARKEAEAVLKKYELMVTSSNDFMSLVDRNYVYQVVNRKYAEACAKTCEEIVGRSMAHVLGAEVFEGLKADIDHTLRGEEIHFHTWLETPGLGRIYVDTAYYPVFERDNSVTGLVVVARDMTDMQKMEDQLIQAQKMEAIGTLAGGITHDFNNILMGIQGHTSLLLQDTDADDLRFESLKKIEEHVHNAKDMIRQLLGLARQESVEIQSVNLNDLIDSHNRIFGRARKEVRLHGNSAKDLWTVEINRGQIKQVLLNLYVNAWQAMPDGGELWVDTQNIILDNNCSQKPPEVQPGKYVKVSIRDTGIGMDESIRRRIFEPFFTTKARGRGMGLGLASAYTIIRNHGGFIAVCSTPGEGTTFDIFLPAARETDSAEKALRQTAPATQATILLVDDEPLVLEVAREMIANLGYGVIAADDGKKAVDIYRQNWLEIDLVILDMIMPGSSGREIFARLKDINANVKVILTSGYDLDGAASQIINMGCDGFMHKPFTMDQLSSHIKASLTGRTDGQG